MNYELPERSDELGFFGEGVLAKSSEAICRRTDFLVPQSGSGVPPLFRETYALAGSVIAAR